MKRGPENDLGRKYPDTGSGKKAARGGKYDTKRQRSRLTDELLPEFSMEGVGEFNPRYKHIFKSRHCGPAQNGR